MSAPIKPRPIFPISEQRYTSVRVHSDGRVWLWFGTFGFLVRLEGWQ